MQNGLVRSPSNRIGNVDVEIRAADYLDTRRREDKKFWTE